MRQLKDEGRAQLAQLRAAAERAALDALHARAGGGDRRAGSGRARAPAAKPAEPQRAHEPARARIGDVVEVADRGIRGELLAIDGARAWIQRGAMRFEVPARSCAASGRSRPPHCTSPLPPAQTSDASNASSA